MDTPKYEIISNILQSNEIDKIPEDIAKKLEKSLTESFAPMRFFLETAQRNYDKSQSENEDLKVTITDLQKKIDATNLIIQELTDTNQYLTKLFDENNVKLKDQMAESCKLIENYRNEMDAKNKLIDFLKQQSDVYEEQSNELNQGVNVMQRLGIEEYKLFAQKLKERDEQISQLKQELKVANEILEKVYEENSERIVENYMPSAYAMHRRLKTGLRFTEIGSKYFDLLEQVKVKDKEINNLKLHFETVYRDIQDKAAESERMDAELMKATSLNEELTNRIAKIIAEDVLISEEMTKNRSKLDHLERENTKLKTSRADLSRQVCHLLNEIECSTGGTTSNQDQSISSNKPANEVITSKLVTFNNIVEMQAQNEKLLLVVRDLSTKLEAIEDIPKIIDNETYQAQQSNETLFQNKIQTLEFPNQIHKKSIQKHEKSEIYMRDEATNLIEAQRKTEKQLGDAIRECSALRRRLEEEQDYHRAQIAAIKSEMKNSENISELLMEVDALRSQLKLMQEQLELKNQEINEWEKKLQQSTVLNDCASAKIKELEVQVKSADAEAEKLRTEINSAADREGRLRQVAIESEDKVLKITETFDSWKAKMSADWEAAQLNETNMIMMHDQLRKEKDCLITKMEIFENENIRLLGDIEFLKTLTVAKTACRPISDN